MSRYLKSLPAPPMLSSLVKKTGSRAKPRTGMCRLCAKKPAKSGRAVCASCFYQTYVKPHRAASPYLRAALALATFERSRGISAPKQLKPARVKEIFDHFQHTCAVTKRKMPAEHLRLRRANINTPFAFPGNCLVVTKGVRSHEGRALAYQEKKPDAAAAAVAPKEKAAKKRKKKRPATKNKKIKVKISGQ